MLTAIPLLLTYEGNGWAHEEPNMNRFIGKDGSISGIVNKMLLSKGIGASVGSTEYFGKGLQGEALTFGVGAVQKNSMNGFSSNSRRVLLCGSSFLGGQRVVR